MGIEAMEYGKFVANGDGSYSIQTRDHIIVPLAPILTIPFNLLTAGANVSNNIDACMTREAKRRALMIVNTTNQLMAVNGLVIGAYESTLKGTTTPVATCVVNNNFLPGAGRSLVMPASPDNAGALLQSVANSLHISVIWGATSAGSGALSFYLIEIL